MPLRFKEPLPLGPFIEWFEKRARILALEYADTDHNSDGGIKLACEECGWDEVAGHRRYYRWRFESKTGLGERAVIEDALHNAGVLFFEVYPDVVAMDEARWSGIAA